MKEQMAQGDAAKKKVRILRYITYKSIYNRIPVYYY